ncbi:MAG: M48 family metallopeptidase [Candidatus Limnocylindrales bacterium]
MGPLLTARRRAGTTAGTMVVIEEPATAELPDGALAYTLRRSPRARHVRVAVDPFRGVVVTVPAGRRLGAIDGRRLAATFLAERSAWVRRHLDRQARQRAALAARGPIAPDGSALYGGLDHRLVFVPAPPSARRSVVLRDAGAAELIVRLAARDARPASVVLETWVRGETRVAIDTAIGRFAPALGVVPTAITIRDTRSRWGSASRAGRLSFSWRLGLAPPEALETVVIHELAHLRIFGHGPRFWALVAALRPDHRRWRRWLREHAMDLHAAFAEG